MVQRLREEGARVFESLDFVYVPTVDVDAAVDQYVTVLGARLDWKINTMGTTVAGVRLCDDGPATLLAGHLEGQVPILIYRVADYRQAVSTLRARGLTDIHELEIPHGPCATFRAEGGQRYGVYQLLRPRADAHLAGRVDP